MKAGSEFHEQIAELLRLCGRDVRFEELIGSKNADLVVEVPLFGGRSVYAVECKDYARRLTRRDVAQIVAEYGDLLERVRVDGLLIVSRVGVSPAAAAFVRDHPRVWHQTVADLERSLIDFSTYLSFLRSSYTDRSVSKYYVPMRATSGVDLEELVTDWIGQTTDVPLAVLGSYGMGKTTFTHHMAARLATQAQKDAGARIPIVLPLGQISAEQTLDGLLGRQFTAVHNVRNYSFESFLALNRLGKFVVFLDGFDEMKHTLTWDEFRYNFQQLLRLVRPGAKVVVLGRPTAFLSDDEHVYVLRGLDRRGGREFQVPDWPEFQEIELAPFDRKQIRRFAQRFMAHAAAGQEGSGDGVGRARDAVEELGRGHLKNIAQRPVQLRMLLEVLPGWMGSLDRLTVPVLYHHFVDKLVEREGEKTARKKFTMRQRREFAREVAWWLWTNRARDVARLRTVPDDIVELFARSPGSDLEAVRRDLVAASFVDRKLGGVFYFPHRSIQEFLVAEQIYDLMEEELGMPGRWGARSDRPSPRDISLAVKGEVGMFLTGLADAKRLLGWVDALSRYRGALSRGLLESIVAHPGVAKQIGRVPSAHESEFLVARWRRNPWRALLLVHSGGRGRLDAKSFGTWRDMFLGNIAPNRRPEACAFYLLCALLICGSRDRRSGKELSRVLELAKDRLVAVARREREDPQGAAAGRQVMKDEPEDEDDRFEEIAESYHGERTEAGRLEVGARREPRTAKDLVRECDLEGKERVSVGALLRSCVRWVGAYCVVEEWRRGADLVGEFKLPEVVRIGAEYESKLDARERDRRQQDSGRDQGVVKRNPRKRG